MRFWDSSAIVPLLVREEHSAGLVALRRKDPDLTVWWATPVECAAAIARLERADEITQEIADQGLARLRELAEGWIEVQAFSDLRETARRFVRVHDLRSGDALQLAAAFHAAEGRPSTLECVALDTRFLRAAAREGFPVWSGAVG
jgi:predicted nucleic acid-binding protein